MFFRLQGLIDFTVDHSELRKFGMLICHFVHKRVISYSWRDFLHLSLFIVQSFENGFDVWSNYLVIRIRENTLNLVIQELRLISILAIGGPNSSQILT